MSIPQTGWLVWSSEHHAWWRPYGNGYTQRISEAARMSISDAMECCSMGNMIGECDPPDETMVHESAIDMMGNSIQVSDPISDLIATAENMLIHGKMSKEDRAARERVIAAAKRAHGDIAEDVRRHEENIDPAAIWYATKSMVDWLGKQPKPDRDDLVESHGGEDEFVRTVAHTATEFEKWACKHVDFHELEEIWPYWLEQHFGVLCNSEVMYSPGSADWCEVIANLGNLPLRKD